MRRVGSVVVLVLVLFLVTAAAAYARPNEWSTIGNHTVKYGETMFCIARAYGVDPWAIASHNGIANPSCIKPGQVLSIPDAYKTIPCGPTCARQFGDSSGCGCTCCGCCPGCTSCTCHTYHTVACGENLYRISLKYGVSMWQIARCNRIHNWNYIRWGDTLCIPPDP